MTTLFFVAGESSGDQLGALMINAMRKQRSELRCVGVAGPLMRAEEVECLLRMEELQAMGFTDVVLSLPRLASHFFRVKKEILEQQPDAVIFIDYPGFNLRMARALRDKGYEGKIIQYVSPTVWAHGEKRVERLAETADLLLTIFPFEKSYYAGTNLPVEYVGHPLADFINRCEYQEDWCDEVGLRSTEGLLALFPGSRESEIRHNFYNQLLTAQKLQEMHPGTPIAISCARKELYPLIEAKLARWKDLFRTPPVIVPPQFRHELMRSSHAAIAVSGTVTLELALHEVPTLVLYHVTRLNRLFARYILQLSMTRYCIVNILSERDLFPELILHPFRLPTAYNYIESLYSEGPTRKRCQIGCRQVRDRLDGQNSAEKAAKHILRLL